MYLTVNTSGLIDSVNQSNRCTPVFWRWLFGGLTTCCIPVCEISSCRSVMYFVTEAWWGAAKRARTVQQRHLFAIRSYFLDGFLTRSHSKHASGHTPLVWHEAWASCDVTMILVWDYSVKPGYNIQKASTELALLVTVGWQAHRSKCAKPDFGGLAVFTVASVACGL